MQTLLYSPGNNDLCYTPSYAVTPLLEYLEPFKGKTIWCPFDENTSQFVLILRNAGHKVIHSHLNTGQSFFTYEPEHWDLIVSNPPFSDKRSFFARALAFGKPFALLMSNTWLNDAAPMQLFRDRGLQLLMFDKRIKYLGQGNKVTFSSSYFCCDLLPSRLEIRELSP
jgi:hypothetical protein